MGFLRTLWHPAKVQDESRRWSRWVASVETLRPRGQDDTGCGVVVKTASWPGGSIGSGTSPLFWRTGCRLGVEWIRYRFHEEILEIVFVEHLIDVD